MYAHCCVFHVPFLLVEIGDTPVLCGFIDGFTSSSLGYQNLSMSFHHLAAKNQKMPKNQHKSTSRIFMTTKVNMLFILWMEEILHQLIDGLSHYLYLFIGVQPSKVVSPYQHHQINIHHQSIKTPAGHQVRGSWLLSHRGATVRRPHLTNLGMVPFSRWG